ncbi:MAG: threonine/serine exporter family protein [Ruminococcaceae bacterium]|nr:threonine/serine exporter family protein [Oscillospiraceae bacterium]
MDYYRLLDFATDLGYELSKCGAETYRVEESITRILTAYEVESEVFAIPNCLIVSITSPEGHPLTYMRRIGFHGNDLDGVALFTALSRRICAEKPDPEEAMVLLEQTRRSRNQHHWAVILLGYFLAAGGFSVFFGGNLMDGLAGGLAGIVVGIFQMFMDRLKTNAFFQTLLSAVPLALIPYGLGALGIIQNPDAAVIGTVMVLIPGLLFTNAMRDIIFGDTNSGVNRIIQVLLIAIAIACGTGVAWFIASHLWGQPVSVAMLDHSLLVECLACLCGALGFCFLFNIHNFGIVFCTAGGVLTWIVHCVSIMLGAAELPAVLIASIFAAIYAEIMARRRKCPAIGYLILGLISLIPGSSLYYTISHIIKGEMAAFADRGLKTIAIAGLMAAGILLVSTSVRMINEGKKHRMERAKKLP